MGLGDWIRQDVLVLILFSESIFLLQHQSPGAKRETSVMILPEIALGLFLALRLTFRTMGFPLAPTKFV